MFNKNAKLKELGVRFYPEDYNKLKELAAKDGLPLASWVRKMLLDILKGRAFTED